MSASPRRTVSAAAPSYVVRTTAGYLEQNIMVGTLKRRDAKLAATPFIALMQSGITKPCLFGIEGIADKIGIEAVVDSAIALFLDGMRA